MRYNIEPVVLIEIYQDDMSYPMHVNLIPSTPDRSGNTFLLLPDNTKSMFRQINLVQIISHDKMHL